MSLAWQLNWELPCCPYNAKSQASEQSAAKGSGVRSEPSSFASSTDPLTFQADQGHDSHLDDHGNLIADFSSTAAAALSEQHTLQRRLLDAPDILQRVPAKGSTDHADIDTSLQNATLSDSTNAKAETQPVHDDAPVEDAAHQLAMQHGSGALESGSSGLDSNRDNTRELHRQLGQRFNASKVEAEVAERKAGDVTSPSDTDNLKAEITPGNPASQHDKILNHAVCSMQPSSVQYVKSLHACVCLYVSVHAYHLFHPQYG